MTVSPKWPDEGNRPPFQEGNADHAQQGRCSSALPPTLFQLPNLRTAGTFSRGVTASQQPASPSSESDSPDIVAEMPFGNAISSAAPAQHQSSAELEIQDRNEDDSRFPAPPAVVDSLDTPATAKSNRINCDSISHYSKHTASSDAVESQNSPAGRSWMDSIGSHGVVVGLLLLVVVAALYTNGARKEDGVDSSLADSHDWLEYSTDEEINLLAHEFVRDPSLGSDATVSDSYVDSEIASADSGSVAGLSASGADLSQPFVTRSSPSVALLQNELGQPANEGIPGVQFEQSRAAAILPPTSVAANRGTTISGVPNTRRQTGQPEGYELVVPATESLQYRQTATPAGITDWSKYFPNVSAGTAANAGYPSPSN